MFLLFPHFCLIAITLPNISGGTTVAQKVKKTKSLNWLKFPEKSQIAKAPRSVPGSEICKTIETSSPTRNLTNDIDLTPQQMTDSTNIAGSSTVTNHNAGAPEQTTASRDTAAQLGSRKKRKVRTWKRGTYKNETENPCEFSFAHFRDHYGQPSEFISLGGTIHLPCRCPGCENKNIKIGTKKPKEMSMEFRALPEEIQYRIEGDLTQRLKHYYGISVARYFVIPFTEQFFEFLKDRDMKIFCTCDPESGPQRDEAVVEIPSYRLCTEVECEENCKENSGEKPFCTVHTHHGTSFCQSFHDHTRRCPDPQQFLYFKHNHGLCFDSEGKYSKGGLCEAMRTDNSIDDITWQVGFAISEKDRPKEAAWLNKCGILRKKSEFCSKDVGTEVNLGTAKVRVMQTYQLNETFTSLTVTNVSTCAKIGPMKAFFCLDPVCKDKSLLNGSCESGWMISLLNFTHFRHQIFITDEKRHNNYTCVPAGGSEHTIKQSKAFIDNSPIDRTFLRFFVIPNRILMLTHTLENTTSKNYTCLFPADRKSSSDPNCWIPPEGVFWQTCYPKFQRFKIADPWPSGPPNQTDFIPSPSVEESLQWWAYLLIALGIIFAILLVIGGIIIFLRLKHNKKKKQEKKGKLAHFIPLEEAGPSTLQGMPMKLVKPLTISTDMSTVATSSLKDTLLEEKGTPGTSGEETKSPLDKTTSSQERGHSPTHTGPASITHPTLGTTHTKTFMQLLKDVLRRKKPSPQHTKQSPEPSPKHTKQSPEHTKTGTHTKKSPRHKKTGTQTTKTAPQPSEDPTEVPTQLSLPQ